MGEKKEKKEKHKDKEHKEGKEDKKENHKESKSEGFPQGSPPRQEVDKDLDQRKLFEDGQKFLTPPVADATRAFYESLYEENPESKIAIKFCVEYGLFAADHHKKIFKRYTHLKEKGAYDARILLAKQIGKSNKDGKEDKK